MKEDKKHYEDIKGGLHSDFQILIRSLYTAMGLISERKGLFNRKTKNARLKLELHSALNSADMAASTFNELIELLESYPDTVSNYLLEQKMLKSLEPKVYKAMAKKGLIELDENGEPKEWRRGTINAYWLEQKRLMKKEYGVDWKSPADRNTHTRYD